MKNNPFLRPALAISAAFATVSRPVGLLLGFLIGISPTVLSGCGLVGDARADEFPAQKQLVYDRDIWWNGGGARFELPASAFPASPSVKSIGMRVLGLSESQWGQLTVEHPGFPHMRYGVSDGSLLVSIPIQDFAWAQEVKLQTIRQQGPAAAQKRLQQAKSWSDKKLAVLSEATQAVASQRGLGTKTFFEFGGEVVYSGAVPSDAPASIGKDTEYRLGQPGVMDAIEDEVAAHMTAGAPLPGGGEGGIIASTTRKVMKGKDTEKPDDPNASGGGAGDTGTGSSAEGTTKKSTATGEGKRGTGAAAGQASAGSSKEGGTGAGNTGTGSGAGNGDSGAASSTGSGTGSGSSQGTGSGTGIGSGASKGDAPSSAASPTPQQKPPHPAEVYNFYRAQTPEMQAWLAARGIPGSKLRQNPEYFEALKRIAALVSRLSSEQQAQFFAASRKSENFKGMEQSLLLYLQLSEEQRNKLLATSAAAAKDDLSSKLEKEVGSQIVWEEFAKMTPRQKEALVRSLVSKGTNISLAWMLRHFGKTTWQLLQGLNVFASIATTVEEIQAAQQGLAPGWVRRNHAYQACYAATGAVGAGLGVVIVSLILAGTGVGLVLFFSSVAVLTAGLTCSHLQRENAISAAVQAENIDTLKDAVTIATQADTQIALQLALFVIMEALRVVPKIPRVAALIGRQRAALNARGLSLRPGMLRQNWSQVLDTLRKEHAAFELEQKMLLASRRFRLSQVNSGKSMLDFLREWVGREGAAELQLPSDLEAQMEGPRGAIIREKLVQQLNAAMDKSALLFKLYMQHVRDKITKLFEALEKNPPPEVQLALLTAAETDLSDAGLARLFFDDSATIFGETISQQAKQAAQSQMAQTGSQKPAVTGAKPAVVVETPPAAAATPPASPTEALPKDPRGPPPASVADAATTPKPAEPPRAQQPAPAAPAIVLDIAQTLQAIEAEAAKAPVPSEQGPVVGSPVEVEVPVPRLPNTPEVLELAAKLNESELAGRLSKAGEVVFLDPDGNTLTMKAKPDPAGTPGSRLWKRSQGEFWQEKRAAGKAFDREQAQHYPYNELYLDGMDGNRYRLDSYVPPDDLLGVKGEIVSRKNTQLAAIQERTAFRYLNELATKYKPKTPIANVKTSGALAGNQLDGKLILEVPVQDKPIPQRILDRAKQLRIEIRDIQTRDLQRKAAK